MKYLKELLFWRNITHTLAVAAVAAAEIVDILVPQLNWLSISENFLLLVLGLIVTNELIERVQSQPRKCFDVLDAWPPFNEYAKNACEIFIAGGSLDGLTERFAHFLIKKAVRGCQVRLVFMDPESPAIPHVELWSDPNLPENYYRNAICLSLKRLAAIDGAHRLEVRLDPSIPALAVTILDGSQSNGRIRVDIQPFQATVLERPVFELTRQGEDLQWYNLFYRQYYEELWSRAKPVDLSNLPSICLHG
jgi:hypothetical protein